MRAQLETLQPALHPAQRVAARAWLLGWRLAQGLCQLAVNPLGVVSQCGKQKRSLSAPLCPARPPPALLRCFSRRWCPGGDRCLLFAGACGVGSRLANPHHCPSPYLGTRLTYLSSHFDQGIISIMAPLPCASAGFNSWESLSRHRSRDLTRMSLRAGVQRWRIGMHSPFCRHGFAHGAPIGISEEVETAGVFPPSHGEEPRRNPASLCTCLAGCSNYTRTSFQSLSNFYRPKKQGATAGSSLPGRCAVQARSHHQTQTG